MKQWINKFSLRSHGLWLAIITLCTVLQFTGMTELLQFNRALIDQGQWYRLLSANFVHINNMHWFMNMLAVAFIMLFFSRHQSLVNWISMIFVAALATSLGIYILNPNIKLYVGFSGVLHGLLVAAALVEVKRFPVSGWLLLMVLIGKLVWEQFAGAVPSSAALINAHVLVDAHLYGALSISVYLAAKVLAKFTKVQR